MTECLFHRTNCICIKPVSDIPTLKMRLEHAIKLNERLNKFEGNEEVRAARLAEVDEWRERLESL